MGIFPGVQFAITVMIIIIITVVTTITTLTTIKTIRTFINNVQWCNSSSRVIEYACAKRPSQIACTVTTVQVTCMQMALHAHENLCTVLIPLHKNDLNLPISHMDHKNNHYHSIFNFQHSSSKFLEP